MNKFLFLVVASLSLHGMEPSSDAKEAFNTLMKGIKPSTKPNKTAPVFIVDSHQKEQQYNELQKKLEERIIESYLIKYSKKKPPRSKKKEEICISFLQ